MRWYCPRLSRNLFLNYFYGRIKKKGSKKKVVHPCSKPCLNWGFPSIFLTYIYSLCWKIFHSNILVVTNYYFSTRFLYFIKSHYKKYFICYFEKSFSRNYKYRSWKLMESLSWGRVLRGGVQLFSRRPNFQYLWDRTVESKLRYSLGQYHLTDISIFFQNHLL